jgi:hypothetical protein
MKIVNGEVEVRVVDEDVVVPREMVVNELVVNGVEEVDVDVDVGVDDVEDDVHNT